MKQFFLNSWDNLTNLWRHQQLPKLAADKLASWDYWSDSQPKADPNHLFVSMAVLVAGVILLALWRQILLRRQKSTPIYEWPINQLGSLIAFVAIVGFSYLFFRSQEIVYLSSRLVIGLMVLVVIGWIVVLLFHFQRRLPQAKQQYLEKERFFRYLPKKKAK